MTHVIRTYDATGTCDDGVCVYDTASDDACTNCCYGAEINPTGDPIGGGVGYSRTVGLEEANYHISSDAADPSEAFLSFLNDLQTGDTLFIDGDVIIDLSGEEIIYIGSNVDTVTMASDRGVDGSLGALIYDHLRHQPLFRSSGDGLRLTGLRIQGPDPFMGDHHYNSAPDFISEGIRITLMQVDNVTFGVLVMPACTL